MNQINQEKSLRTVYVSYTVGEMREEKAPVKSVVKTVRVNERLAKRISAVVEKTGMDNPDVIRDAIRFGLPILLQRLSSKNKKEKHA